MTKPPPAPPSGTIPRVRRRPVQNVLQLDHYAVPVRSSNEPEWKARLREAGYPPSVVVIDFETYFDPAYRMHSSKLSTIEYITDRRFEVLGVATLEMLSPFDDYEQRTVWWPQAEGVGTVLAHLQREYGENLEKCTVVAQNAVYDGAILTYRYGITPPHVIDILGLARHWSSRQKNDLATLANLYNLPAKGETQEFTGLSFRPRFKPVKHGRIKGPQRPVRRPLITDEQHEHLARYSKNDVMREWELFTLLLPRLSNPNTELPAMQHTLELFWSPTLGVDQKRGGELVEQMTQQIGIAINAASQLSDHPLAHADISKETLFSTLLGDALTLAGDRVSDYHKPAKNKQGSKFAIAKTDPAREKLEQHRDSLVRALMNAKAAISSWPNHISRVQRILRQATAAGGKLPVALKYCGAHTGRWSGAEQINLQNLGSRGHELINAIRELLIALPGDELVIADASQIEARVLAWVAGQLDLLLKFAQGEEIYCGFASRVLGWRVRKPRSGGIAAVEARHKWARNSVGKVGVLGCGYGMGAAKAETYAGHAIDFDTAERIVKLYRQENAAIVKFWHDLERAFIYTAKYQKDCQLPHLGFHSTADANVVITLPNGRELKYHKVQVKADRFGESLRVWNGMEHNWVHVWGGYLAENVVQAISRDILWEAIDRIEHRKIHVAHHIHDELVAVVPKGTGTKALAIAVEELNRRPSWAQDCPLGAEGIVTDRYGGH